MALRNKVGGYQGPVAVLTLDGVEVARAACRYRAEEDANGIDHWDGRLHRINPHGSVSAGEYRLRLPEGQSGDVTIRAVAADSEIVYFQGIGDRPPYP
jgi:hypothetical protein